jgi:hypothetical protein
MKALFRRRKRQAQLGDLALPDGIFTQDHMAELETWLK